MSIANNQFELQLTPEPKKNHIQELFEIVQKLTVLDQDKEVNLTPIAKAAGKRIDTWKKTNIEILDEIRITLETETELLRVKKGFDGEQGTYTNNPEVLLEFLRYCSPKIAVKMTKSIIQMFAKIEDKKIETYRQSYQIENPIERAKQWIIEQEEKQSLQLQLQVNKPKVEYAQQMESSVNSISIDKFARTLDPKFNLGEIKLYAWLRDQRILCVDPWNAPAQKYITDGFFEYKPKTYEKKGGKIISYSTCKITGEGQIWLTNKISKAFSNQIQIV
jgi:phage antirepressor YoqD-like protein